MISSNSSDEPSNKFSKDNIKREKATTNHHQAYQQIAGTDHYLEDLIHTHDSLDQKFKSLISQLSADTILNLTKPIHEFQMKSDEIVKSANIIEQRLQNRITHHPKKSLINEVESDQNGSFEDDIERLKKDIEELRSKLEEINNDSQKRTSQEQNSVPSETKCSLRSIAGNLSDSMVQKADNTSTPSYLVLRRTNPSISDLNENEVVSTVVKNKTNPEKAEEEEEAIVVIGSNTTPEISKQIHLSNNVVRWLRGPLKLIVNGLMSSFDICAQGTHISDTVIEAVERRIVQQKQITNNSFKSAFTEITSDWRPEGDNSEKGFSSSTSWMRDPQDRRLLLKTQELPLGAVNEWLAYVLGSQLGLPVNEVQISVYQNNLVTLHTDITQDDEKTITLLELPKEKRDKLMTNPIIESMDIFDHIIQNVDRNLRNILVTISKTDDINDDDNVPLKIRLIDHSSCFGMGKLNFISIVAAKFHSNHLSVVKFDPIHKARQFEQYLNEIPIADRTLISETLNRFAAITNDQFDTWITEMQDLLSSSQYNRIHNVLCRQRDIARRCTIQWGICPKSQNVEPNETNQLMSEMSD